ncbi:MAG: hydroxymethylbilane synthase [Proteobacteria bacterium]|nr:hydroxymethylbilane synthase [Pseudomonadota bacterium]
MSAIRIATRGSELALAQARSVAGRIRGALGADTELVVVKTSGDRLQDVSLAALGGKGLFVKEIEEALLEGRADVAVHSAKDLPAALAPGLVLAAFPERADPRDALVGRAPGATLTALAEGARVGTGSVRRAAALRALRPDVVVVPLRGNVPTRLRKLEDEGLDAVILACAGLDRLGLGSAIHERISPDAMLPAVCQGTLALETREDHPLAADLAALDDPDAALSVAAERSFLAELEGDCNVPLAALAEHVPRGGMRLRAWVASPDGRRFARAELEWDGHGGTAAAAEAGRSAARQVRDSGGRSILDALEAEA